MQMLLQDAVSSLSPRMTLRALLAEPIRIHRLPFAATWAAMEALLHQLGLPGDLLGKYPHQISGGQARRVAMARALILGPALLVADEPTAGLDVSVQGEVLNLLLDLHAERGLAMLIVSHNLNVVRRVTDRMMVMYLARWWKPRPPRRCSDGRRTPMRRRCSAPTRRSTRRGARRRSCWAGRCRARRTRPRGAGSTHGARRCRRYAGRRSRR